MDNVSVDSSEQPPVALMPPVDIPLHMWRHHPALRDAQLDASGDGIQWPNATFEQLAILQKISLVEENGTPCARLSAQFNFDRFVDEQTDENAPAYPPGHTDDRQRFYVCVTESGFRYIGIYCAATVDGRRRYFQWLDTAWLEIGLSGFLTVRDAHDTHFSEVTSTQLDASQRDASSTPVLVYEDVVHADPAYEEPVYDDVVHDEHAPVEDDTFAAVEAVNRKAAAHRLAGEVEDDRPSSAAAAAAAALADPVAQSDGVRQQAIAIAIATIVHRGDVDLAGEPMIDHVGRVAESFDVESMTIRHCAAWLHHVLELGPLTERDLRDAGVAPEITTIVTLLTKNGYVDEDSRFDAIVSNPDALAVKTETVADNSAPWRLRRLDPGIRAEVEASCARARAHLAESRA